MSPQVLLNLSRALSLSSSLQGTPSASEAPVTTPHTTDVPAHSKTHYDVLILGGGVAGVMAARELHAAGVDDFLLVEARDELGGRLMSHTLTNGLTVELGANWIEGLHSTKVSHNPIWQLASKHNITLQSNSWQDISFYDQNGPNEPDFRPRYEQARARYKALLSAAGHRIAHKGVDLTARTGYKLSSPRIEPNQYDHAAEYYHFDWEYGQTPDQSSWIATANNYNRTFEPSFGGFGIDDKMCIDQRGFKHFLLAEAHSFLQPQQLSLRSRVKAVNHTHDDSSILLSDGRVLTANHTLVTFSTGVLQHDDVLFHPKLPSWKVEAIESMKMATYTKIFLVFEEKWWHDTQMGLYAHPHRRGYFPVWQSLDHTDFFPGKHVYFVTATGDESERLESMSDDDIQAEILQVLAHMYPYLNPVPPPTEIVLERWFKNPLFRGAWSNWPPSFYLEHMTDLRASLPSGPKSRPRLHFAGEATSQDYYGYLHGAFFEGVERGRQIAACLKNAKDCDKFPVGGVVGAEGFKGGRRGGAEGMWQM